jgi:MtN3 and saliva related transmembrane protein
LTTAARSSTERDVIDAIGWASSVILVMMIATQIHKQWKSGTSEGVSTWLFIGQLVASTGFTIYSLLLHNWVFSVTNGIMLLSGLVGWAITVRQKRKGKGRGG